MSDIRARLDRLALDTSIGAVVFGSESTGNICATERNSVAEKSAALEELAQEAGE